MSATTVRFVNFYPPVDAQADPHPWRTTSWVSEDLARRHAKPGALAIAVRVEFEADDHRVAEPRRSQAL